MKRIFLMTAALAAAMFASCDKTNNPGDDPIEGEAAKLNIEITSPALSRAPYTGTLPTETVANFNVFVTDQSDEIVSDWSRYSADGAALTGASAITVTTQAKHVYVVANTGGSLTSTITTMAQLNAFLADLNGTTTLAGSQTSSRWATGSTPTPLSFTQSGSTFSASTTVTLKFIAARITVKIVNSMSPAYDATKTDGSLVLEDVYVLNARGESKLFGTSLIPATYTESKKYYEGLFAPQLGFAHYPAGNDFSTASDGRLSDAIPAGDFTTQYVYYVFENDADLANEFPTIVTLEGTFDEDPVFFPVHLAPYEFSSVTSVTRGKSYDITITLTGDPTIGGGDPGGTDDPTDGVASASVDVAVNLTQWDPVVLNKEFE